MSALNPLDAARANIQGSALSASTIGAIVDDLARHRHAGMRGQEVRLAIARIRFLLFRSRIIRRTLYAAIPSMLWLL